MAELSWYVVEIDRQSRRVCSAVRTNRAAWWRPRCVAYSGNPLHITASDELDAFLLVTQWIEAGMPEVDAGRETSWVPGRGIVLDTKLLEEELNRGQSA